MEELETQLNVKFPPLSDPNLEQFLDDLLKSHELECTPPRTVARMLDKLVGDFIEDKIISPAFITEHPTMMSPLAKYHRSKPDVTERFELFVAGREICNAYTELNNPRVQRERFQDQMKSSSRGDDEAQQHDEGYCIALEHGLAPTGGWGLGVDRMTMFLSNNCNIKEVLLFPAMKPKVGDIPAQIPGEIPGSTPIVSGSPGLGVTIVAKESTLFAETDLGSVDGLKAFEGKLGGKSFLGGSSPSKEDAVVYEAMSKIPDYTKLPSAVLEWYQTVGLFVPTTRATW